MKNYFSKLKKKPFFKLIVIILLLLIIIPAGVTFTRFITEVIKDYYLESKNFYFNSNRLKKDNATYQINNWSGVGEFPIEISVNSHKNNLLASNFDVAYTINYTCSSDVICDVNKTSGVIFEATHTDTFILTVTPDKVFNDGESTTIHIEAESTSPYVETISADFQIVVGKRGVSYFIDDEANRPYLLMTITNALTHYTVKEAFANYQIGDQIDSAIYKTLSETNKQKCKSITVTLDFDPNDVILDITSSIFNQSETNDEVINGVPYVNQITFSMDAMSSIEIRFYKIDNTQDYTYPFNNNESIIDFSAV